MTYFPKDLTSEKQCTRAVVKGLSIQFVPLHLRTSKVYFKMLKTNGLTLRDIPLEDRKSICANSLEKAVKQNGLALEFVPKELITESLCYRAVSQNPHALKWVPSDFKSIEMCMLAYEADPNTISYILKKHRTLNRYHSMVIKDWRHIQHVPNKVLRSSYGFAIVIDAVRQHGFALFDVPQDLREGPGGYEICMMAVGQNGLVLSEVPMKYRTIELCQLAVEENPEAIEYVPSIVRSFLNV